MHSALWSHISIFITSHYRTVPSNALGTPCTAEKSLRLQIKTKAGDAEIWIAHCRTNCMEHSTRLHPESKRHWNWFFFRRTDNHNDMQQSREAWSEIISCMSFYVFFSDTQHTRNSGSGYHKLTCFYFPVAAAQCTNNCSFCIRATVGAISCLLMFNSNAVSSGHPTIQVLLHIS